MSSDASDFIDALGVLRRQGQWRLDALQRELGEALRRQALLLDARATAEREQEGLRARLAPAAARDIDPLVRHRVLQALGRTGQHLLSLQRQLHAAGLEVAACRDAVHAQQRRLDGWAREDERWRRAHRRAAGQRAAAERDADWLVRRHEERATEAGR